MENLGETIKALRLMKKMSISELSKKLGIAKGTISYWENNKFEPSASYLKKLAIEFSVTADYLLGLEK